MSSMFYVNPLHYNYHLLRLNYQDYCYTYKLKNIHFHSQYY